MICWCIVGGNVVARTKRQRRGSDESVDALLEKDEDDDGLTAADVSVVEQTLCLLVNLSNVEKIKDNLSKDDSFIATLLLILVSISCLSYFVCAYSRTRGVIRLLMTSEFKFQLLRV